jgi:hypothetical protein
MMMGNKFVITMLAATLGLPALGFAAEQADVSKAPVAAQKQAKTAPSDCRIKGKATSATSSEKRRKHHAENSADVQRPKLVYNKTATEEHGRKAHEHSKKDHEHDKKD